MLSNEGREGVVLPRFTRTTLGAGLLDLRLPTRPSWTTDGARDAGPEGSWLSTSGSVTVRLGASEG